MGLLFFDDKNAMYDAERKCFRLEDIKALTLRAGIAMSDTVKKARRLKGNASDKFLEVVEGNDPRDLLRAMPECMALATTGEKAAGVIAELTGTEPPKMGSFVTWEMEPGRTVKIWRLPSTSRAYPMKLERKAEYYRKMLEESGVL